MTMRRLVGVCLAAALACGLTGVSAAGASGVHARYKDKQGLQYTITKAITLPHGTKYTHPPRGYAVVLFYVTEQNTGSRSALYGTSSLVAAASKTGSGFQSFDPAPDYHWIGGGTLRVHRSASGWFGYEVPTRVKTVYLRFDGGFTTKVLLTYHPHP